ncbi:cytochrome b/b6 domain-containing protein [Coriobacteriales bacterium OH1046]|nr:cytochrome b/b6 domain-containing protein [Coriobacteriales bacterium OH1046]
MSNLSRRLGLDLVLTIMLVLEMFYSITGNTLHEAVGFAFFLGVGMHLLLSRAWIAGAIRTISSDTKTLSPKRARLALVAGLLVADGALLVFSSLVISNTLYRWGIGLGALNTSALWATIHTASAYGLCVLAVAHLAMHWPLIAKSLRVAYDPSRRTAIGYAVGAAAAVGMFAIGNTGLAKTAGLLEGERTDGETVGAGEGVPREDGAIVEDTVYAANEDGALAGQVVEEENEAQAQGSVEEVTADEAPAEGAEAQESEPVGTCPLCRNHCPLSSPGCNRPYDEGILS